MALVTGAGSGVGRATARALSQEGFRLVLAGRTANTLAATADVVAERGGAAVIAPVDVGSEPDVRRVVALAGKAFGGIDVLIHAAAIGLYGPVDTYALADWDRTIATNLTSAFLLSRAVLPSMRARGGGAIIAIASGAGKQGYPTLAAYAASKFGLIGFMQSLAGEVSGDGIKVCTVVPGSIMTGFAGRTAEEKHAERGDKRYLEPEDVAEAILFLLRQPDRAWTQELNLWPF
ncbi:MAG: SDR family oxidoreductase [Thermomicrobiales bacterium]